MDPATGMKATRRSFSSIDAPKHDQQQTGRSRPSAAAAMLPIAPSTPEAPVTIKPDLTIAALGREESPEREIWSVRRAPHGKRQTAIGISSSVNSVRNPSSQFASQQGLLERSPKRTIEHSADGPSKRMKLPITISGALATQEPQTTPVANSFISKNQCNKISNSSTHSLRHSLTPAWAEPASPECSSTSDNAVTGTELASTTDHSMQGSRNHGKHWTARSWTARQYHDLADMAMRAFPYDEYMRKHNKSEQEVREVFSGVVMVPILQHVQRGVDPLRGGLGEQRMTQYREMEKETMQNIRAEARQERMEEDKENRRKNRMAKHIPGKSAAMAEAQEEMDLLHRQLTHVQQICGPGSKGS